jgi:hypothetical protein
VASVRWFLALFFAAMSARVTVGRGRVEGPAWFVLLALLLMRATQLGVAYIAVTHGLGPIAEKVEHCRDRSTSPGGP